VDIKHVYNGGNVHVELKAQRVTQPESIENMLPEHVLRLVKRQIGTEPR
jgi:hypothetical protein